MGNGLVPQVVPLRICFSMRKIEFNRNMCMEMRKHGCKRGHSLLG